MSFVVDGNPALSHKTNMTLERSATSTLSGSFLCATSAALVATVATTIVLRTPGLVPMPELDLERQLLAGSDALLERMVIPPHQPDWVLMDCSNADGRGSAYDRVRSLVCEAAHKSARN